MISNFIYLTSAQYVKLNHAMEKINDAILAV